MNADNYTTLSIHKNILMKQSHENNTEKNLKTNKRKLPDCNNNEQLRKLRIAAEGVRKPLNQCCSLHLDLPNLQIEFNQIFLLCIVAMNAICVFVERISCGRQRICNACERKKEMEKPKRLEEEQPSRRFFCFPHFWGG